MFNKKEAFRGIRALYGNDNFERFQCSHVTVIGIGGIGSWCTEALCRTGIGHLTLIDSDCIEITNVNRQLHTNVKTVGQKKTDAMAERLYDINPELKLDLIPLRLTPSNIDATLENNADYVCECIDDIDAKSYVVNYLFSHHSTFICAGGAGGRKDPQRLRIGDLAVAAGDALISKLRSRLRKEYNLANNGRKTGIICTYSDEKPVYSSKADYLSGDLPAFGASMSVTASAGLLISSWILSQIVSEKNQKKC